MEVNVLLLLWIRNTSRTAGSLTYVQRNAFCFDSLMCGCETCRLGSFRPQDACGLSAAKRVTEMLGTILLIVLILMLLGAIPAWPHSRSWGYGPTGGLGLVVIILIILLLMGRI
jgi:hypothetical protein